MDRREKQDPMGHKDQLDQQELMPLHLSMAKMALTERMVLMDFLVLMVLQGHVESRAKSVTWVLLERREKWEHQERTVYQGKLVKLVCLE